MTLSSTNGLRATASLYPFPPAAKEDKKGGGLAQDAAAVAVLAFDPRNAQYLAVGSSDGALALVDMNAQQVVQTFEWNENDVDSPLPVSSITWSAAEAGVFFTSSRESNLVKKWNISSRTAQGSFNPHVPTSVGILCLSVMDKDRLVLTQTDGAVRVFSLPQFRTDFKTTAGHTDTMLSCAISKHDSDLVASCGTDGTVRVWNLRQMALAYTIDVGPVMVYSVDWSPNGKYLLAALANGEVVQYQCATRKEVWRASIFSDMVYKVRWSIADTSIAAGVSRSGAVVFSTKDGKVLRRYNTRQPCMSVDIEPTRGKSMAVASYDHKVYVYNFSTSSQSPAMVLSGHSDSVVDIAYNPSAPQFLCTGSYDSTLRVWDLSSGDVHSVSVNARVLKGHTDRVRSVAWCSFAPYFCLSGSSDASIRVWDVRNGVSVTTVRGHSGDVGCIASHPERPLVFLSAAKDATMVLWHLTLLRQVYLDAALGTLDADIVADPTSLMAVASGTVSVSQVCGAAVQRLAAELRECAKPVERMEKLVHFFEMPCGAADVAEMAAYLTDPQTYSGGGKGIVTPPVKMVETRVARAKKANEKAHGKTVAAAGSAYRKERLRESAEDLLRTGQLEEYCSVMMEIEEWDRAIAMAPVLSREYWRAVCLRAAETLEQRGDSSRAVTYYIIAEEGQRAAQLVARQSCSNSEAAVVISRTCPQRSHEAAAPQEAPHNTTLDSNGATPVSQELLQETCTRALEWHHNPRLFAAVQLAHGNSDQAVRILAAAGDIGLVHLLVHTAPMREQASIDAAYRLSMLQSARQHKWETAVLCAARVSNPYDTFASLIAYFQYTQAKQLKTSLPPSQSMTSMTPGNFGSVSDKLRAFYETVRQEVQKLQLPLDPNAIQQRHAGDGLASQNQLAAMVLQADPQVGPVTSSAVLQSFTGFLESLLQAALQDANSPNCAFYLRQAYAVTGYVSLPIVSVGGTGGSVSGPAMGMAPEHRRFLAVAYLIAALMCVKVYQLPKCLNGAFTRAREMAAGDSGVEQLLSRAQGALGAYGPASVELDYGAVGSQVPSLINEGKQVLSILSGEGACGALQFLEDGTSCISREEALGWSMVCHFSPLPTGSRISVL
ncbi:hypothetical protein STCU_04515 [Strigomonas culicis]|uniref:Uncharacterized protein n=1 Tax=Strigomonas culicis TaxID=28005 RepID=S9VQW5_9TRYP|nr:hypothetical protein STCU_04515 [Strigomonas culicis]|eukprot:EPY29506.1 hypothetical protein STCU_04515 [Strigomonas culicis]